MATHQSVLTPTQTSSPSSEVETTRQTDGIAHKLKPRSFHKSTHLQVHSADFHSSVNCAWQYYQTPKSAVASEQFHLLNPLSQFCLQSTWLRTSKSKWLSLAVILQLWSHCWGHPLTWSHISVNRWLIHQTCHNVQDDSISKAIYLQGLPLVQSNLARQFCPFLA